jgi:ketosteroid isomerase-like protein
MNDEGGRGNATGAPKTVREAEPRTERLKRIVREARHASQMVTLPSAVPGDEDKFVPEPTGLVGLVAKGVWVYTEPAKSDDGSANRGSAAGTSTRDFSDTAVGPVFVSYGPMLADGDQIAEEWESQMYTSNGTIYNNQYMLVLRFDGDSVTEFHLHDDSQHANLTYGQSGGRAEPAPSREPRQPFGNGPTYPGEMDTPFEIVEQFDLDPRMLCDAVASASAPPVDIEPGVAGNRAVLRGLRRALALGDQAAVNSFYGPGYRHFIAGDRPFGWDHLPLEEIYAPLVEHLASPLTLRFGPVLADETRAFEQMMSFARLDDGTVYNNWHAVMYEIRGGKIVQTREYLDTCHVWATLGRWASWADHPATPLRVVRRSNLQGIAMTVQYKPNQGPDLARWQPLPPVK